MASQKQNGISWTDETWSPIVGCSKVSEGCENCWAEKAASLHYHDEFPTGWNGQVKLFTERLEQLLHFKKPRRIAVGLMGDLFHEAVPDEFIDKVFAVMALCPQHTFQVLTKRPQRMLGYLSTSNRAYSIVDAASKYFLVDFDPVKMESSFPFKNCWLGVSVENQAAADERIPLLIKTPAAVRFVSAEPLLGQIDFYGIAQPFFNGVFCKGIDWVIVAGESGLSARPIHPDWVRSIRHACQAAGVPFHFKGWGEWTRWEPSMQVKVEYLSAEDGKTSDMPRGIRVRKNGNAVMDIELRGDMAPVCRVGKRRAGRLLDGREWLEFPEVCQ